MSSETKIQRFAPSDLLRGGATTAALAFAFHLSVCYFLPTLEPFMAVLLTGIVFLGFPHGALDIFLIQDLGHSPQAILAIVCVYLLAILAMVFFWILFPNGALLFFIAYSCFHFAQSDLSREESGSLFLIVEFLARLLAPFFIPFGFHPERSLNLARQVQDTAFLNAASPLFQPLALLAVVLSSMIFIRGLSKRRMPESEWQVMTVEPLIVCILFLVLDPLYSLSIYFCFIHSVKHLVNFLNSSVAVSGKKILPVLILPIVAVVMLPVFFDRGFSRIEDSLFKWSILILSSLALPHAILISLCKRLKLIA